MNHAGLFRTVLRVVAEHYEIPVAQILGQGRRTVASEARWFCFWLLRREGMSYGEIGRLMDMDHSSVIYGVRKLDRLRGADVHLNGRLLSLHRVISPRPRGPGITDNGWGFVIGEVGWSLGETGESVSRETVPA